MDDAIVYLAHLRIRLAKLIKNGEI
jgi:hypothetical protein